MCGSKCVGRLQQQLHGTTKGRVLHAMQAQTLTTINNRSSDVALDIVQPDTEEEANKAASIKTPINEVEDPLLNPSNAAVVLDLLEEYHLRMLQQVRAKARVRVLL